MIQAGSLVLYKNDVAFVLEVAQSGKYTISFRTAAATASKKAVYASQSVRAKDIVLLHEGKAHSLEAVLTLAEERASQEELALQIKETHELLLSDDETAKSPIGFLELAELFHGSCTPDESWSLYLALKHTLFFSEDQKSFLSGNIVFVPRALSEIEKLVAKEKEKGKEAAEREAFMARLKAKKLMLPEDAKFMVDVEALALGKTDKSRTLHEAHIKESPERAHKVLLDTGLWNITRNPYPVRWGLSMQSASEGLSHPPEEERLLLSELVAYAIDNAWSTDPDDAVSFDGTYVWVHIADPASTVLPDSSIDIAARMRGATLYIPEGAARMLSEDSLSDYALGLSNPSRALSFRLKLNEDASIEDCAVFKTLVSVKRLTYEEATLQKDSAALKPLFEIAKKNIARRLASGAVNIQMPEVHINVSANEQGEKIVSIETEVHPESADMVREMMLLAGEGAARFAFKNRIPFPYVSQEAPSIPQDIPEGLAGQFRLRRCMHRRSVGTNPAMHSGLGLALYSQVTSPLRRYGDLIAHEQLRAFLDKRELIDKDTMLLRVSAGEEAAQAAHQAERKSNLHWKLVFLLQNPTWTGKAVCVDLSTKQPLFSIPALAMEAFITPKQNIALNESIVVKATNINLPELTVDFCQVSDA